MTAQEVNFDGLAGPTHNYAGLSFGNVASKLNAKAVSNPRAAAKQGLRKMLALHEMGFAQAVLPPHERPHLATLRDIFGFSGSDTAVLDAAWKTDPALLLAVSSAAPMWTANAATISASADTADGRVHITPANLCAMFHRAIEHEVTGRVLQATFPDHAHFAHHPALPGLAQLGDEGAANHTRFAPSPDRPGVALFVYGRHALHNDRPAPQRYPARQTYEASAAIARHHQLDPARTVFAQQAPQMIDAGVFHNDVIAVGSAQVLFYYQDAFVDTRAVVDEIRRKLGDETPLSAIEVPATEVPLGDVVASYLFNSQLLVRPDGSGMTLVVPIECQETDSVRRYLEALRDSGGPIDEIRFFDLRQSMRNGGGPACLRLRVPLTTAEIAATNPKVFLTPALFHTLDAWVDRHYRDRLTAEDLRDPELLRDVRSALDALTEILGLGSVYDFQRG